MHGFIIDSRWKYITPCVYHVYIIYTPCVYYLQCFSSEKTLIKHKENCLIINGKQSIKLKSGSIKFKNYFKKLATPSKSYADFESLLKGIKSNYKNNASYTEKYQDHIPCSFSYKVVCIDNKFSKKVVLYRRKNADYYKI